MVNVAEMTLRDYFAAQVLPYIAQCFTDVTTVTTPGKNDITRRHNEIGAAQVAYAYADAMLAERSKQK